MRDEAAAADFGLRPILLWVQFDGGGFCGFQRQANGLRTVGGDLEVAWQRKFDEIVIMRSSSRTDAGVHARRMPVLVRTRLTVPPKGAQLGLNAYLGEDLKVLGAEDLPADFDVRADATGKRYVYRVQPGPVRLPLWRRNSWHCKGKLDLDAMRAAAARLVGAHDFAAFRSVQCTAATTLRTLHRIDVATVGEVVELTVEGNAFLHNMVRILAGTLVGAGRHRFGPSDVDAMLAGRDRSLAGQTAPAHGLTLDDVFYGPYGARQGLLYKQEQARAARS